MITIDDVLSTKRDGGELTPQMVEFIMQGLSDGGLDDAQVGALAMAIFIRGMANEELVRWTKGMAASGTTFSWGDGPQVVDKHSTGGIGDKVSLVLAPLVAAVGFRVPMLSGRGLGYTGGTLDKLEAIPGFRAILGAEELEQVLSEVGCFIAGAGSTLCPADARLYAIRDVTATVASIPLIASSIVSKKVAGGSKVLLLDVKWGSGAFCQTFEQAEKLAVTMKDLAAGSGVKCSAVLTPMNMVLGRAAGNLVEITESMEILAGRGPTELRDLILDQAYAVIALSGSRTVNRVDLAALLQNGKAMSKWEQMIAAQGGDLAKLGSLQPKYTRELQASRSGEVWFEALSTGKAVLSLGAGRTFPGEAVDYLAGIELLQAPGAKVNKGDSIALLHSSKDGTMEAAKVYLEDAVRYLDAEKPGGGITLSEKKWL